MADTGCDEAMRILNILFEPRVLRREGAAITARLEAGDFLGEILVDMGKQISSFKRDTRVLAIERVVSNWPESHREPVSNLVRWIIARNQAGENLKVNWKGDAEYHETVIRIELKEDEVNIEFMHPPAALKRLSA